MASGKVKITAKLGPRDLNHVVKSPYKEAWEGSTVFHVAARYRDPAVLKTLLSNLPEDQREHELNQRDKDGATVLDWAERRRDDKSEKMVKLLVDNGAKTSFSLGSKQLKQAMSTLDKAWTQLDPLTRNDTTLRNDLKAACENFVSVESTIRSLDEGLQNVLSKLSTAQIADKETCQRAYAEYIQESCATLSKLLSVVQNCEPAAAMTEEEMRAAGFTDDSSESAGPWKGSTAVHEAARYSEPSRLEELLTPMSARERAKAITKRDGMGMTAFDWANARPGDDYTDIMNIFRNLAPKAALKYEDKRLLKAIPKAEKAYRKFIAYVESNPHLKERNIKGDFDHVKINIRRVKEDRKAKLDEIRKAPNPEVANKLRAQYSAMCARSADLLEELPGNLKSFLNVSEVPREAAGPFVF